MHSQTLIASALGSTLLLSACSLTNPTPSSSPTAIPTEVPATVPTATASPAAAHGDEAGDGQTSDDRSFLLHMIPHHEDAVRAAQAFLKRTKNVKLVKTANDIIAAQTKEVAQMKAWYKSWFGSEYVADGKYESEMPDFSTMDASRVDARFMQNMIAHHQDAVEDARDAKPKATHAEIKQLADDIVLAQTKEINEFRSMLSAMGEDDHDDTGQAPHDD